MKKPALVLLAVAAVIAAGVAFSPSAEANPVRGGVEKKGQTLQLDGNPPLILNGNSASATVDLLGLSSITGGRTCNQSSAITVPNAKQRDVCLVTADFDGGYALPAEVQLSCDFVADATAKVKLCGWWTDGGSLDLFSATFTVRSLR